MPDANTHLVCRRLNASLSRKISVMSLHFLPQATHVGSPAIRSTLMADRSSSLARQDDRAVAGLGARPQHRLSAARRDVLCHRAGDVIHAYLALCETKSPAMCQ